MYFTKKILTNERIRKLCDPSHKIAFFFAQNVVNLTALPYNSHSVYNRFYVSLYTYCGFGGNNGIIA